MTRTAIYCRISRDHTGEALGVKDQEADCRQLAADLGWEVVGVFPDNDLSAYSGKPRPKYRQMLADIAAGKVDAILAWDTSRLYRQLRDLLELVEVFERHGTAIRTVKAGEIDLSTPSGRTNAIILARINQHYSEEVSIKVARSKQRNAEAGKAHAGGRRPFGSVGQGKAKVSLARALSEQECINEAVKYLLGGGNLTVLAADWRSRGIKTPDGNPWKATRLREMLLSPRLAGRTTYGGREYPATWAPIVEPARWEQLQAMLTNPARTKNKGASNQKYVLSGVAHCGKCGNTLTGRNKTVYKDKQPIRSYRTYSCARSTGGCEEIHRKADDVERLLFTALFAAVESPAWRERVKAARSDDAAVQALLNQRTALIGQLDRLQDKLARELIDEPAFLRNRGELRAELDDVEGQLERHQDDGAIPNLPTNLRQVWPDLSEHRQREIIKVVLRRLGRRLEVHPQGGRRFDPEAIRLAEAK